MNGPGEFRAELRRLEALIHDRARAFVQTTARTLANEMMTGGRHSPGTPIDTGFHRSHWDAAVGALPAGGSVGGLGAPDPSGAALRVDEAIAAMEPGDQLFIANNGPAIRRLEFDGHSKQAPSGFVRPAAEAIQAIADEAAEHVLAGG